MGTDKDVEYVHLKSQIPVSLISLATIKRPLIYTIYRYRQDVLLCSVHYEKFSKHKPCEYWEKSFIQLKTATFRYKCYIKKNN